MHQIGVGVLGPVFRTYEPSADRLVAVKAFHLDITPEQVRTLVEALERLLATGLAHPGIVAPLAAGLEDDAPYLAQEYVAAESLDVAIRHYAPAPIATAMPFISQMAAAIDAAHKGGVVHGALHLRDIFVSPDEVRVTGFGIVTALQEVGLAGPIRRPYTAPEVIAGRAWGAGADRFALAAIAYELLTGRRAAGTGDQVTERIRSIEGVADPEHLEEVFATALADDPEERYSTAARFVSALESGVGAESGEPVGGEPEIELNVETVPLDLLAGLELHPEDSGLDRPADGGVEPRVSAPDDDVPDTQTDDQQGWSPEGTTDVGIDAIEMEADEAADLEVRESPAFRFDDTDDHDADVGGVDPDDNETDDLEAFATVEDRYIPDGNDGDEEDGAGQNDQNVRNDPDYQDHEAYPDSIPGLPPPADAPRSVWSRGIVAVLAIALVVGGLAYVLGGALAPTQGPTDRVLDSGETGDPVDRELTAELVARGGGAPSVGAADGAPTTALEAVAPSVVPNAPAEASPPVGTDSDRPNSDRPDMDQPSPEPPATGVNPVGAPRSARPGTRTVQVPATRSATAGEPSSPGVASTTPPFQPSPNAPTGWILIRTDPPGATVILDGVGRGQTPLSLHDVSFGTHRLEVSRAGFSTVQRDVTVSEQDTVVPVGVTLSPANPVNQPDRVVGGAETGSLAVRSRPPGAGVTVDGAPAGVTPLVVALPVGRYQVQILGDGYQPWETSVEVTPSERAQVGASLERLAR